MRRRYFAVQELFLGYFHPDWQLDADARLDVVTHFLRAADAILIDQVIDELRELVQEPVSDDELHQAIDEDYSLYYDPSYDNLTMRAWLAGLLQELESGRHSSTPSAPLAATRAADARER
jgi:CdiI immunity protein